MLVWFRQYYFPFFGHNKSTCATDHFKFVSNIGLVVSLVRLGNYLVAEHQSMRLKVAFCPLFNGNVFLVTGSDGTVRRVDLRLPSPSTQRRNSSGGARRGQSSG